MCRTVDEHPMQYETLILWEVLITKNGYILKPKWCLHLDLGITVSAPDTWVSWSGTGHITDGHLSAMKWRWTLILYELHFWGLKDNDMDAFL